MEADSIAHHAVNTIFDHFDYKLQTKEAVKKLPEHLQKLIMKDSDQAILVGNYPRPIVKYVERVKEDSMRIEPPEEPALTAHIPSITKKYYQLWQKQGNIDVQRAKMSSRYASTSQIPRSQEKKIRISINPSKQFQPLQAESRAQQATATSTRSAMELESQIRAMRSTYLKKIKQQAKIKMSMTQKMQSSKKKRMPKQFTFDISGDIIEKRDCMYKKATFSPVRLKAVSVQKITKKAKKIRGKGYDEEDLQQILQRAETKTGERKKRLFNNQNKRQVSHIPFINLVGNSKMRQNSNVLSGPSSSKNTKEIGSIRMTATFVPYFRQEQEKIEDLIDNEEEVINIPCNFNLARPRGKPQGSILKNFRFLSREKEGGGEISVDFNPANVTREHGIDKYYKLRKSTQFKQ